MASNSYYNPFGNVKPRYIRNYWQRMSNASCVIGGYKKNIWEREQERAGLFDYLTLFSALLLERIIHYSGSFFEQTKSWMSWATSRAHYENEKPWYARFILLVLGLIGGLISGPILLVSKIASFLLSTVARLVVTVALTYLNPFTYIGAGLVHLYYRGEANRFPNDFNFSESASPVSRSHVHRAQPDRGGFRAHADPVNNPHSPQTPPPSIPSRGEEPTLHHTIEVHASYPASTPSSQSTPAREEPRHDSERQDNPQLSPPSLQPTPPSAEQPFIHPNPTPPRPEPLSQHDIYYKTDLLGNPLDNRGNPLSSRSREGAGWRLDRGEIEGEGPQAPVHNLHHLYTRHEHHAPEFVEFADAENNNAAANNNQDNQQRKNHAAPPPQR